MYTKQTDETKGKTRAQDFLTLRPRPTARDSPNGRGLRAAARRSLKQQGHRPARPAPIALEPLTRWRTPSLRRTNRGARGHVTHGSAGDVWADRVFRASGPRRRPARARDPRADRVRRPSTKAWPAFQARGLLVRHADEWIPNKDKFGALAFIYGTLVTVADRARARGAAEPRHRAVHHRARVAAAPHARDLRHRPARRDPVGRVRLWGVPRAAAPGRGTCTSRSPTRSASVPVLGRVFGGAGERRSSFMTAGVILAVMITPIITSLTREALAHGRAGRQERRARRWARPAGRCCASTVFPRCARGLVGAVMLGLGPRDGRDDRGRVGDRLAAADHVARLPSGRHDGGGHRPRVR